MSLTNELIDELERTLKKMIEYRGADLSASSSQEHASAHRASLDLTKKLSQWRSMPSYIIKHGQRQAK